MQILHINCNYIGTTLHQLMIEHLDRLGYVNQVFVPTYDDNLSVINPNSNVCVCECFKKWDRLFFDYKQNKILQNIERKYRVDDFDLIHAYTLFTDGNVAMRLSKKFNKPYIVAIRNTDVNTFFKYAFWLRSRGIKIMKKASAIIFLSEAYKKTVFEKYIPKKHKKEFNSKSFIIPNGIDDFWYINQIETNTFVKREKKESINLIYAGRIDINKNIITTQKAMKILTGKGYNVNLTIVGKIENKKLFLQIIKDKNTKYFPAVSKEQLINYYRSNDIFVMPSFHESFGLVYAEALTQGLPIIYTKNQGFDKQFDEGVVGYSINPYSPNSICEAILKIINANCEIRERCIINSYKFKWSNIAKVYSDLYSTIDNDVNSIQ